MRRSTLALGQNFCCQHGEDMSAGGEWTLALAQVKNRGIRSQVVEETG
jgi:hypothetical protein